MDKPTLRKTYLQKRRAIPGPEKLKLDDLMLIQFQRLAFDDVACVMSYWPLPEQQEPNTHLFSSYLRHMIPELQIAYPKSDFEHHSMEAILIDTDTVYEQNIFHLMEPVVLPGQEQDRILSPEMLDLIFIPMIVCDTKGYRVGYGKGFYDRFLARCRKDVLKIGWSYFPPVPEITGIHPFDLPLDYCITPDRIYAF